MIGVIVTTHNRVDALQRSLPQIVALGAPVLVVDDGSEIDQGLCDAQKLSMFDCRAEYFRLPGNRGLAAALNIGLSYWLADKSIKWISYFQDDVDVHPATLEIMATLQSHGEIMTGHDAVAHKSHGSATLNGIPILYKWSSAGVHIHASADFWKGIMPIPTFALGAPMRKGPGRGVGSNVDWWIVRDCVRSSKALGKQIICVPHLVRTFFWEAKDSSWNNSQPTGEEPPLSASWRN